MVAWIRRHRLDRFTLTGVASVVVSQAILWVCHSLVGLRPGAAAAIAAVATSVPMYFVHRAWVWNSDGRHGTNRGVVYFTAISALGLAGASVGAELGGVIGDNLAVQIGAFLGALVATFARYYLFRFWLFPENNDRPPGQMGAELPTGGPAGR